MHPKGMKSQKPVCKGVQMRATKMEGLRRAVKPSRWATGLTPGPGGGLGLSLQTNRCPNPLLRAVLDRPLPGHCCCGS